MEIRRDVSIHASHDRWWVYDYFDGTREIDKERYPSCAQIREWMNAVGFTDTFTSEVQHLPGDAGAAGALLNGMVTPSHTSQLAVLTRDEFSAGVERIRAEIQNNSELRLTADLRVLRNLWVDRRVDGSAVQTTALRNKSADTRHLMRGRL